MGDVTDHESCSHIDGDLLRADLDETAREVTVVGFAALWSGRPVPPSALLPGREALAAEVITALAGQGRAEVDDDETRLMGVHGLTLRTTRHSFVHDGRAHHTWCAFDSIGIPAALNLAATAHTDCPACGRPLTVEIADGSPGDSSAVLWLPDPTGGDLMTSFCARADAYCSPEHLHRTIDTSHAPGTVVDIDQAASLGRDVWADVAGLSLGDATNMT